MNRNKPIGEITSPVLISQLGCALLLGVCSSAMAAKPIPIDVNSSITIFPKGYEGYAVDSPPREACIRDRAGLNSLTCSANDVRLAEITLPPGSPSTCKAGEVVTQPLNFKVKSTANIRYNFAFYTTTTAGASPLEGPGDECLIWVGEVGEGGEPNSQSVNGDMCADVTKAQDAKYTKEPITFICQDTDGDTQVDMDYCATWDQNDDALCNNNNVIEPSLLPVPGAPSKCNCESVTIPVTVLPSEPILEKAINGVSSRPESDIYVGTDEYSFDLNITNPNTNTSLIISQLTDNFGGVDFSIPSDIKSAPGTLSEDQVVLISATDTSGTCLESGSETIAVGATYTCTVTFKWKSLALTDTNMSDDVVREDKINNFSAVWEFDSTPPAPPESVGPSNDVTVSITDVPPILTLLKEASPTSIFESGETNFDLVDYTVTFGNDSGWDEIHIETADLEDFLKQNTNAPDQIDTLNNTCTISDLGKGETPTCPYSVNMATEYPELNAGDIYTNTVIAIPTDEEGTKGDEKSYFATVDVNNVDPTVELKKYVKAGSGTVPADLSTITGYDDIKTSVDEFQLTDLTNAPVVTYLFVVENTSDEVITIKEFVDFAQGPFSEETPALAEEPNIADTIPLAGSCSSLLEKELAVGAKTACVLSFKVQGDESESVENTAWVLVSDGEGGQDYDTDRATVEFDPAPINLALSLGTSASVEVIVAAETSNVEEVYFNPFNDFKVIIDTAEMVLIGLDTDKFYAENIDCDDALQALGPGESYRCSVRLTAVHGNQYDVSAGLTLIERTLKVIARDDDDSIDELDATLTVKAIP